MRDWRAGAIAATGIAALALLPAVAPPYYVSLMIPFFGYAIALLGFNLLFGYTGLLSFGMQCLSGSAPMAQP
jgi:branched-chain amino acid transport system permease protein